MWSSLFLFLKRDDLKNENLEADRVDAMLQYDWCM